MLAAASGLAVPACLLGSVGVDLRAAAPLALVACAVAMICTPLAGSVARRIGALDVPDPLLKPHAKPTPYLGGAAICLGWACALLVAGWQGEVSWPTILPPLIGGTLIALVGAVDDLREIRPKTRLALTALVIAGILLATGAGSALAGSVLAALGFDLPSWINAPLSLLLGVFIVLGACNALNMIDGLDGLCSGMTVVMSLAFALLASLAAHQSGRSEQSELRFVLAVALLGASLGFLPLNFNPARIFMGDAGSLLLGFNCGLLILLFADHPPHGLCRLLGALMIFAPPIFDGSLAVFRRWRTGKPLFIGDRSHFYDQLVQRGLSVKRTVLICYLLTGVYAALGVLISRLRLLPATGVFLATCLLTALAAWVGGFTHPETRQGGETSVAE